VAHLHRLAALLAALLLPLSSWALVCTQYSTRTAYSSSTSDTSTRYGWTDTKQAACDFAAQSASDYNAGNPGWASIVPVGIMNGSEATATSCTVQYTVTGTTYNYFSGGFATRTGDYCSAACPTELAKLEASMTSVKENLSQATAEAIVRKAALSGGVQECSVEGCVIARPRAVCGGTAGVWRCELTAGTANASTCSQNPGNLGMLDVTITAAASTTATGTVSATAPGGGYCPGYVNGVLVYVRCSDTVAVGTSTSSVTSGSVTNTTNAQTTTVCSGATCTSTVTGTTTSSVTDGTTTTSVGTVVRVETTPQNAFCVDNPTSTICNPSAFAGTCDTAFTCDGDAAMCAAAKATNAQNCLLRQSSSEKTLYENTVAGGSVSGLSSVTTAISSANFSQVNALGVSGCFTDKTYTIAVAGITKNVTIAFSTICPYASALGDLLVAVSMLMAMGIVFRRS